MIEISINALYGLTTISGIVGFIGGAIAIFLSFYLGLLKIK